MSQSSQSKLLRFKLRKQIVFSSALGNRLKEDVAESCPDLSWNSKNETSYWKQPGKTESKIADFTAFELLNNIALDTSPFPDF